VATWRRRRIGPEVFHLEGICSRFHAARPALAVEPIVRIGSDVVIVLMAVVGPPVPRERDDATQAS
jgi:hypothetical protein